MKYKAIRVLIVLMAEEGASKPARMTVEGAKVPRSARLVAYSTAPAGRGRLQAIQGQLDACAIAFSRAVPGPQRETSRRHPPCLVGA
jgi:hypothetical protein